MTRPVLLLAASLLSSCGSFAAEPTPEQLLPARDAEDAYTPAACFGCVSGQSPDKGVYLVVWQSGRFAPGDLRDGPRPLADIVGCRLDHAGKLLDSRPFTVCAAPQLQQAPRIAFDGKSFLVAWQDLRNGKDFDVYAARVTPDGKVLDPDGFLVCGAPQNQAAPDVAWDGRNYVVTWQDFRSAAWYEAWFSRVSADGRPLDTNGVKLASGNGNYLGPVVASAGGGRTFAMCIGCFGLPIGPEVTRGFFLTDGKPELPCAYTNGLRVGGEDIIQPRGNACVSLAAASSTGAGQGKEGYLLAWKTEWPFGRGNYMSYRNPYDAILFDAKGAVVKKLMVRSEAGELGGWNCAPEARINEPKVIWDGAAYAVAWHEWIRDRRGSLDVYDCVFAARISPAGDVGPVRRLSGTYESPASNAGIASDGSGSDLVVYEKQPDSGDVPIRIGFRMLKGE
jgi:hypothetical protein